MSDKNGKLLGIDHGIQRIGVAVCDALRISARELTIIQRRSKKEDFAALNALAAQENVVGIVIGIPLDLDAPEDAHTQADTVRLWAERYAATTQLPIIFQDEQLSSAEATDIAIEKKRGPRDAIDDLAARVILQRYLDAVRDGLREDTI